MRPRSERAGAGGHAAGCHALRLGHAHRAREAAAREAQPANRPPGNPHNEYLNLAVQLGIPGAIALITLFAVIWRHARGLPTALERDLARGLALTFAIGCLFNSLLMDHVEGLFFAWSLGVLFGGYDPARMRTAAMTA